MKKTVILCLLVLSALSSFAQIERPKLVVGLVADQMRWDYMYYYYDKFGDDGIKRLLGEGFSFENCMLPYVPTTTAIGHTTIYTGSVPAIHGICGNDYKINDKHVYCCEDNTVKSVGSSSAEGLRSPRNLLSDTFGDELKLATDYRSKVIGVALKDRAAILPAGHAADAAYFWDQSAGHFITSSYYMDELPRWVKEFNKKNYCEPGHDIKTSNEGVTMTFKMAEAVLENEKLGQGNETDVLAVSISSTDAIGHAYSTRGEENYEVYMQFDKDLGEFLKILDKTVGKGNYLIFLSADHGATHNPNTLKAHKLPGGGVDLAKIQREVNAKLKDKFGADSLIDCYMDTRFYLSRDKLGVLDFDKVKAETVKLMKEYRDFDFVIDYENLSTQTLPPYIKDRFANGYNRNRTGDIGVVLHPSYLTWVPAADYKGTSHSMWNPDDAHVPCVFMGWKVPHGESTRPVYMTDIAPTICAMLHIQMPNGCVGNALQFK